MTASVASTTVHITPDLEAIAADLRAAVAAELRRIADELSGLDTTTVPEEPTEPPRYVLIRDNTNDLGILDTELGIYVDYGTENRAMVEPDLDALNAGTRARRDLGRVWRSASESPFNPLTPVDSPAPEAPTPRRFVLVKDNADELGILDTELNLVADFETEDRTEVDPSLALLNKGESDPGDFSWERTEAAYPPYTVVDG